ncbi:AAA domain-containing protein [Bacillus cereus group sp. BfR-BA-01309]|uniref:AAA domain-containing protein n=1 Tax=Bacillus cereus group sp. BfR-BA-01309 TaxID=2920286 RepID=UPI001F586884|nr:AAA domain-containing protein [Bacillus cereus group sp. BfR-BA-01309]
MIPFIAAGLAVVGIGATIGAFIFDTLTEEEKREQSRIRSDYEDYVERNQEKLQELLGRKQKEFDSLSKSEQEKLDKEIADLTKENHRFREIYHKAILAQLFEHQNRRELVKEEISSAISRIREIKKRHHYSLLRKQSLTQLEFTLQESLQKIISYLIYLKKYKNHLNDCVRLGKDLPEPFEFLLPNQFPYRGQVLYMKKGAVTQNGIFNVNNQFTLNYLCVDYDMVEEYDDHAEVPLFVDYYDFKQYSYVLSIAKGTFKDLALFQPSIGIEAKVTRHDQSKKHSDIFLDFKSINLKLPRKNLDNPLRLPPRGTKLRVFPSAWDYFLKETWDIIVTERFQESLSVLQFQRIPLVIPVNLINSLNEWMEKNDYWNGTDEWKIAPFDENNLSNLKEIKLQLGTNLVLRASMQQYETYNYLRLEDVLSNEYMCKPDDVFVAINTDLFLTLEEEIPITDEAQFEELNQLCILLIHEFKNQKSIKESHEGMLYFNKWAEITDRLITYKFKGPSQLCQVRNISNKRLDKITKQAIYDGSIKNINEVRAFLEKERRGPRHYFIEANDGTFTVRFHETGEGITVYGDCGLEGDIDLLLYEKNMPYPEIQQKNALNGFRQGLVSNSNIKMYVLNSLNVESSKNEFNFVKFYNSYIEENPNQNQLVRNSLQEKEFYMIQGPPGTGKTTVIIEIIQQYLANYPNDRVLIVSQANVAVDNVMKDLIDIYGSETMIRCGKADKIDPVIQPVSFEKKYEEYMERLERKKHLYGSDPLFNRWYDEVSMDGYNAHLGELILISNKIIGATCVGLAQKSIGLDRLEFDLVIIDEAGKALPAELLIPINRAKKLILIGDQRQLPPTLDSALFDPEKVEIEDEEYVKEELFEKSLFEKLYVNCPGSNKGMLATQYRMPAVIGTMISEIFYDGQLRNGESTYHKELPFFGNHLNLIEMSDEPAYKETAITGKSPVNEREADMVADILQRINEKIGPMTKIAIITPYKGQKRLLQRRLLENGLDPYNGNIAVNTVDAFQGEEAEIVFYCMTRSKHKTNFFSDIARINVAISRTKSELLIIGSIPYMKSYGRDSAICKVANYVEKHGVIVPYSNLSAFLEECLLKVPVGIVTKMDSNFSMQISEKEDAVSAKEKSTKVAVISESNNQSSPPILPIVKEQPSQKRIGKIYVKGQRQVLEKQFNESESVNEMSHGTDNYNHVWNNGISNDEPNLQEVDLEHYGGYRANEDDLGEYDADSDISIMNLGNIVVEYTNNNSDDAIVSNIVKNKGPSSKAINDDLIISSSLQLSGVIKGDIVIRKGGELNLSGIVQGDITLETASKLQISGVVNGDVLMSTASVCNCTGIVNGDIENNGGKLTVSGFVNGYLYRNAGTTDITKGASIAELV